jgi:hypothetical protein
MNIDTWQSAKIGDMAHVKNINKSGMIIRIYGRKFHLKFIDSSEKTFDKNELEIIKF